MEDKMEDTQVHRDTCALCSLSNSSDDTVKTITDYIVASLGSVAISEICEQTRLNLLELCNMVELKRKIFTHIMQHTTEQRVVLGNIMRDLVELSTITKSSCIYTCEDTGRRNIDVKCLTVYLKTVDQITRVYKMQNMRVNIKKETLRCWCVASQTHTKARNSH